MKLEQLIARGGFVSPEPVKVHVKWERPDPETGETLTDEFDVFVMRRSFGSVERLFTNGDDKSKSALLLSECIRLGENGEERLSYEQAYQLDPSLASELIGAYNSVHTAKTVPKT